MPDLKDYIGNDGPEDLPTDSVRDSPKMSNTEKVLKAYDLLCEVDQSAGSCWSDCNGGCSCSVKNELGNLNTDRL